MSITDKVQSATKKGDFAQEKMSKLLSAMGEIDAARLNPDTTPAISKAAVQKKPLPAAPKLVHSSPVEDVASVAVPTKARLQQRKLEKSLCLEPEDFEFLFKASLEKSARLSRRVSISEVARAMISFARAHVQDNQVIPTEDGLGLYAEQS